MQLNLSLTDLHELKSFDLVELLCQGCSSVFLREKCEVIRVVDKKVAYSYDYCCRACRPEAPKLVSCEICRKSIKKRASRVKNNIHNFCSNSCSAIYRNAHKRGGGSVSKLEKWIQACLDAKYANLHFIYNSRVELGGYELDIYLPDLSLAFEINGCVHFFPIFGEKQLDKVKSRDKEKIKKCCELGVLLTVVDSSQQKSFSAESSTIYLKRITDVIDSALTAG